MGKLVPQDPNDEPANILLSRLRLSRQSELNKLKDESKEAATMLKKLSKLPDVKIEIGVPENWSVVHLIDISLFLVDCHNKSAPYQDDGFPIIRQQIFVTGNSFHLILNLWIKKHMNFGQKGVLLSQVI